MSSTVTNQQESTSPSIPLIVDTDALARAIAPLIAATVVDRLRIDALAGDDLILNTEEAAQWLGRSPHTLDMWRKVGQGPEAIVFGRRVGYRLGALRDYTRSRPRHGRPVLQKHGIMRGK